MNHQPSASTSLSAPTTPLRNVRINRRNFIKASATGAGAAVLGFPAILQGKTRDLVFQHGVASGDPTPYRAIIWTRVTPEPDAMPGSGLGRKAIVHWEVALDPDCRRCVRHGFAFTGPEQDHTVKVDVGLIPNTTYFFRFQFRNTQSPIGRLRTAPRLDALVPSLRFGLVSCSNFEGGFFSAYRHMAARDDLDFVLHVGDYLYEYEPGAYGPGGSIGRIHHPTREIVTLADYRQRHAQYKSDPDLQALHAACAFICTWDDHELTNHAWSGGAENHQPDIEGDFATRRANAYRAYFEWMPIRLPESREMPTRIYRQFQFGRLADLSMLDLRQYRDQQPANGLDPAKDDAERVIVGREQLDWLKSNLGESERTWKLIGNSVMITPVDFRQPLPPGLLAQLGLMMGVPFNVDAWDGYTDDRRELLDFIADGGIDNVAFLTGDIHSSWACNVPRGPGSAPSVAVELVGTSVTSDNLNEILGVPPRTTSVQVETVFKLANPHIEYLEFDSHGYSVVDVSPERLQMDWFYISDRSDASAAQAFAAAYEVPLGANAVRAAVGPLGPRP